MALMYARYPHKEVIERAVKLVMNRQLPVSAPRLSSNLTNLTDPLPEWVLGARGDRGHIQQDMRHYISKLQVFFHNMDAR